MVYLLALLIFVALSAACWFASVACYRGTVAGSDPDAAPYYRTTAAAAIAGAAVTSLVPFPAGYVLGLGAGRAAVLFLYLAAGSYVTRLVVFGVLELLRG